jgi:GTP-binding protein LepA
MEIVQERLEREFGLDLVTTVPAVEYHIILTNGESTHVENPSAMPDAGKIREMQEPYVRARILCPAEYIGNVQKLCYDRRGEYVGMHYLDPQRVEFTYDIPLAEIVLDFYDKLKGTTRGYASLDWEFTGYRTNKLVKLDMMINGEPVDAFSVILHEDKAYEWGRAMAEKLRQLIPRQMFEVALQATIGNRIIARESIRPLRKNVTAKCYGGDITRTRKLLEKQKEGKKRMKQVGTVEIPQEAFLAVLQVGS